MSTVANRVARAGPGSARRAATAAGISGPGITLPMHASTWALRSSASVATTDHVRTPASVWIRAWSSRTSRARAMAWARQRMPLPLVSAAAAVGVVEVHHHGGIGPGLGSGAVDEAVGADARPPVADRPGQLAVDLQARGR